MSATPIRGISRLRRGPYGTLYVHIFGGHHLQFTAIEMHNSEDDKPSAEGEGIQIPKDEDTTKEDDKTENNGGDSPLMQRIDDALIKQGMYRQSGLTIADIATTIGSNKTYISSCINRERNVPFNEYVNRFRIDYAKKLLMENEGKITMSEVAQICGYSGEASLYRNFKFLTGTTPSAWLSSREE